MSGNKENNEENLGKAKAYLQRFGDNITGHFINGQFEVPTNAETFENFTPVDNTTLGKIVAGSAQDIDRA
ncbi:MAG: 5-carboxymethyl-2-hydroxymuconate semialdehyde dehydrogenase, partial [Gammaproteobacteria bacterium]|nr:5-carboxymethyl-2-hydroxymuconate semialdehyde dehydrogenase [Gammaproteobacteria bacterium]